MKHLSEFSEMISSPRLELRMMDVSAENAQMIFEAMDASRQYIEAFQGFLEYIKSPDDVKVLLEKRLQQRADDEAVYYGIFHLGEFIGRICFKRVGADCGCVGYWQTEAASGYGYMTEALAALEREVFGFGFNKIMIEIDDGNVRSENVAKRNGYELWERRPMASWAKCVGECDELVYVKVRAY